MRLYLDESVLAGTYAEKSTNTLTGEGMLMALASKVGQYKRRLGELSGWPGRPPPLSGEGIPLSFQLPSTSRILGVYTTAEAIFEDK